jgi:large subunit ribosomal protein L6
MSRIAKKNIAIPSGVKLTLKDALVTAEGPKGKLTNTLLSLTEVKISDKDVQVGRRGEESAHRTHQGTMYRIISNMIHGVSKGYQKTLKIDGVGFRAEVKGSELTMLLGYSHPVQVPIPKGLAVKVTKATEILIEGNSKHRVGQFAAVVRSAYEPEPYKGKGIRYTDEVIRRKAGKAVVK